MRIRVKNKCFELCKERIRKQLVICNNIFKTNLTTIYLIYEGFFNSVFFKYKYKISH